MPKVSKTRLKRILAPKAYYSMAVSTPEAVLTAYHALFESNMRYGIMAWEESSEAVIWAGMESSCRGHFKELKLMTVVGFYIYEVIVLATSNQQTRHQDLHGYNTRNAQNFSLPAHHRTLFEKNHHMQGQNSTTSCLKSSRVRTPER
ncbi:hypothetical protein J6590_049058 [Homalodisca vitripennis]|nr:hypothetical protein J6590_049058 [Homalodisca vitripennis]